MPEDSEDRLTSEIEVYNILGEQDPRVQEALAGMVADLKKMAKLRDSTNRLHRIVFWIGKTLLKFQLKGLGISEPGMRGISDIIHGTSSVAFELSELRLCRRIAERNSIPIDNLVNNFVGTVEKMLEYRVTLIREMISERMKTKDLHILDRSRFDEISEEIAFMSFHKERHDTEQYLGYLSQHFEGEEDKITALAGEIKSRFLNIFL